MIVVQLIRVRKPRKAKTRQENRMIDGTSFAVGLAVGLAVGIAAGKKSKKEEKKEEKKD